MTFDPSTGSFSFGSGTTLSPTLTRVAFLASPEGQMARKGYRDYWFDTDEGRMRISISFGTPNNPDYVAADEDLLSSVSFGVMGPPHATSWGEWTPEKDQVRTAADRAWLASQGVTLKGSMDQVTYPWGTIGSYYDHHNLSYSLILRYLN